jgi:HSP20 family protein
MKGPQPAGKRPFSLSRGATVTVFLFTPPRQEQDWQPAVDIYRTSTGWILKFDIAGVRLNDVHVHVSARSVTVSGVRRDWMMEDTGCRHYSMEISYSRFQRTIELPEDIQTAKLAVDYRDGILFVRIAKREEEE